MKIITINVIKQYPVTVEDLDICEKVFGRDIYTLKGKTVNTKPNSLVNDYIYIPQELKDKHQTIEICVNIM